MQDVDKDFGLYEGTIFKTVKFRDWLISEGISWPLTKLRNIRLDKDTFHDMGKVHPKVLGVE